MSERLTDEEFAEASSAAASMLYNPLFSRAMAELRAHRERESMQPHDPTPPSVEEEAQQQLYRNLNTQIIDYQRQLFEQTQEIRAHREREPALRELLRQAEGQRLKSNGLQNAIVDPRLAALREDAANG